MIMMVMKEERERERETEKMRGRLFNVRINNPWKIITIGVDWFLSLIFYYSYSIDLMISHHHHHDVGLFMIFTEKKQKILCVISFIASSFQLVSPFFSLILLFNYLLEVPLFSFLSASIRNCHVRWNMILMTSDGCDGRLSKCIFRQQELQWWSSGAET